MHATTIPASHRVGHARPNPRPNPRLRVQPSGHRLVDPTSGPPAPLRPASHQAVGGAGYDFYGTDQQSFESATRGRNIGIAVAVAIALATVAIGFTVGDASATLDGPAPEPTVYIVRSGDTLWAIASKVAPGQPAERVVSALRDAAGSTQLVPGQRIVLPRTVS